MNADNAYCVKVDKFIYEAYLKMFEVDSRAESYADSISRMLTRKKYSFRESNGDYAYYIDMANSYLSNDGVTKGSGYKNVLRYRDRLIDANSELSEAISAYEEASSRYEGWSRFYAVPGGHIHSSMSCSTCNKRGIMTKFEWLTSISGLSVDAAIAEYGPVLCSACFPDAPVELTMGTFGNSDDDICEGTDTEAVRYGPGYRYGECAYCGEMIGVKSRMNKYLRKHKAKK